MEARGVGNLTPQEVVAEKGGYEAMLGEYAARAQGQEQERQQEQEMDR